MKPNWLQFFITSAGGILLAAALNRFLIAAGNAQVLSLPEPILGLPLRSAVLLVGGFELIVALLCLFGKQIGFQIAWLAWLSTNFIVYRIAMQLMHCHPQATCLGSLTDPLHLARGTTGFLISLLPIYLLLGSFAALLWLFAGKSILKRFRIGKGDSFKMSCPSCGVHINFASQNEGQKIPCPKCQKTITLRKPDHLKMVCFYCKENVEFPTHAIGEKMPCPHCNKNILLKEPA